MNTPVDAWARSRITPGRRGGRRARGRAERLPPSSAAPSANAFRRFQVSPAMHAERVDTSAGHVSTPKHSTPSSARTSRSARSSPASTESRSVALVTCGRRDRRSREPPAGMRRPWTAPRAVSPPAAPRRPRRSGTPAGRAHRARGAGATSGRTRPSRPAARDRRAPSGGRRARPRSHVRRYPGTRGGGRGRIRTPSPCVLLPTGEATEETHETYTDRSLRRARRPRRGRPGHRRHAELRDPSAPASRSRCRRSPPRPARSRSWSTTRPRSTTST